MAIPGLRFAPAWALFGASLREISPASGIRVGGAFAEDYLQLLAPAFAQGDEFPIDFGGEITQQRQVGGVDAQGGGCQKQTRWQWRDFCSGKVALACEGRERAVAGGNQFESLRLCGAHTARHHAETLRTLLNFNNGAHEVSFFAPELEQAAAVGLGYGVAREAHVEEDAAVFEQGCCGMCGEVVFEDFSELGSGWCVGCSGHADYQFCRERRLVMCAV